MPFAAGRLDFQKEKKKREKGKKSLSFGSRSRKNARKLAPHHTFSPHPGPADGFFLTVFFFVLFFPSDPDVCRCGRSRSVQVFSHAAGSCTRATCYANMLRLMGTIGNLRARPSGGGRRGVVLAKEIKVCLGMNKG